MIEEKPFNLMRQKAEQMAFSHFDLEYNDKTAELSILANNESFIIVSENYLNGFKIYWAANEIEYMLQFLKGLADSIYIEFVPPEAVSRFKNYGFRICSEWVDFF